jgi:DNA/RNA-binding domain of Phe-tRNA-synthetase-like protein
MRIVVAVAAGLDNRGARPEVTEAWRTAWREAAAAAAPFGNAQSHPRVRPWRERFRAMGVSGHDFPSSIEALLRRAMKGAGPFSINSLVDFYNAISLRHVVPAGGYDLAHIGGPIELRLTRDGDAFTALDGDRAEAVPPGEVAYADGDVVLTRHIVWRQSREALISPETTDALLLSEVLGEVESGVVDRVLADLRRGLRIHFAVDPLTAVADAASPRVRLASGN